MESSTPVNSADSLQTIAWKTLQVGDLLGQGSYGNVYKGDLVWQRGGN